PTSSWPSGQVKVEVTVFGDSAPAGYGYFYVQHLDAPISVAPSLDGVHMPGDPLQVNGTTSEVTSLAAQTQTLRGVPASFYLQVTGPNNVTKGPFGPYTAGSDGTFSQTLPR